MITTRLADQRGHAERGWLDSWHTFSFGDFHDPRAMGYGDLRVINEDRVVPGAGFPAHSHSDMEIISYVLEGGLRHRDSTGGGSVIRHGEVQLMSAGRGISHSEMNDSQTEPVHFLQIWVVPSKRGVAPGYQQKMLDQAALRAGFSKVIAPEGEPAPFRIYQDAHLYIAWPVAGQALRQPLAEGRRHYLHVAKGAVQLGRLALRAGDAAMLENESILELTAENEAELLLFELPPA
ncbi:pirin family protein [Nevskia soli]|uniref:pirin family protein n=1 Tax=Nevskia soli TaxID=418856 RepID=UPI0004A6EB7A|nr:pirin family protein [Nevskia soli]